MNNKILEWVKGNLTAILLVVIFIPVFIWSQNSSEAVRIIGTTSMKCLNNEFYRWFTCIFYHCGYEHIIFNSIALISIGSLIDPYTGRLKTALLFVLCGALAEVAFSIVFNYSEANYGGGSSGGIFGLMAVFLVCLLRFGGEKKIKWYRPDLIITVMFFIFANDNVDSFVTHVFGFTAGILLGTVMVLVGCLGSKRQLRDLPNTI